MNRAANFGAINVVHLQRENQFFQHARPSCGVVAPVRKLTKCETPFGNRPISGYKRRLPINKQLCNHNHNHTQGGDYLP